MHQGMRSTLMSGPPSEIERDGLHLPTEVITEFLSKLPLVLPTEVITEFLLKLPREKLVLPTEVIIEILSKLPTMTVVSLQCVSKLWFNILGDDFFRDLHSDKLLHCRSPSQPCPSILFCTAQMQEVLGDSGGCSTGRSPVQHLRIITMKCPGATSHYVIRTNGKTECSIEGNEDGTLSNCYNFFETNHCNGLLCMAGTSGWLQWPIMLCNPATLEYLFLPPCTGARSSESSFALGFASLSKQYKVVCIHSTLGAPSKHPNPLGVLKVYTLGDDTTWRVVDPHVDFDPIDGCRPTHLYANGKIYWVITGPYPNQYRLLSFDVESEQASVMGDLPPISRGGAYGYKLAQLGGRVSLSAINLWDVEVWMLKNIAAAIATVVAFGR